MPTRVSSAREPCSPHSCSSRTRGTLRPEVLPRRACHPLGPLKAKIASFLMWVPLWREPPRTEAPSPRHLLARAGFPSPLRTPPPTPAVTSGPCAGKASLEFRTLRAKARRGKINSHHRQAEASSPRDAHVFPSASHLAVVVPAGQPSPSPVRTRGRSETRTPHRWPPSPYEPPVAFSASSESFRPPSARRVRWGCALQALNTHDKTPVSPE